MNNRKLDLKAPNGKTLALNTGLFIDNQFVEGRGKPITSINPTDESEIATVSTASASDIDKAVQAARAAFTDPSWRKIESTARGTLLFKLADLIEKHKESIATLEAWDTGKPYQVALASDVSGTITTFRYYAGWADKIHAQTIPTTSKKFAYTLHQPIGVCGLIIPWNFPLLMAAWKLGPALACGNTVVLKPAEQTPLSILYFASLVVEAGFPPGVVNIVNGYGSEAGMALVSHLDVDKIAFTGSTATGRLVMRAASANLKNLTLETGGKSPLIVFEDADIEQAAKWAHVGVMSNMGQVCTATSRLLVHEKVLEKFVEKFKGVVKEKVVGDPFSPSTFQGPQASKAQYDKVLDYIRTGHEEGAVLTYGGKPLKVGCGKGYFIQPTIFTGVKREMRIFKEEVFGPFAVISSFQTEEEALIMANDTEYGLSGAIFTKSIERAHRVSERLEAGMVWVNSSNDFDFRVPFGGVKQSGIGRELGEAGLAAYSQTKAVHINIGLEL